jgi:hypothetical protein
MVEKMASQLFQPVDRCLKKNDMAFTFTPLLAPKLVEVAGCSVKGPAAMAAVNWSFS